MENNSESANILNALRADAWHSLSALFVLPANNLSSLHEDIHSLCDALEKLGAASAERVRSLSNTLERTDEQQCRIEFTRLFIGPFQTMAPPYGSVYLEQGRLMGESTIAVMNAYVEAGLKLNERYKDLPDHIAAEFEFLYFLLTNSVRLHDAGAQNESDEIMRVYEEFLHGLLMPWIPAFCERITLNTHLEYFRLLAETLLLVVSDLQHHS